MRKRRVLRYVSCGSQSHCAYPRPECGQLPLLVHHEDGERSREGGDEVLQHLCNGMVYDIRVIVETGTGARSWLASITHTNASEHRIYIVHHGNKQQNRGETQ